MGSWGSEHLCKGTEEGRSGESRSPEWIIVGGALGSVVGGRGGIGMEKRPGNTEQHVLGYRPDGTSGICSSLFALSPRGQERSTRVW